MADTIKRLARMACLVTTLACMTGIAMGQTRVEPEQPRWGQTLTIIYDPAAKGAKFSLADEVYLSAHLSFAGRSEGMVVKMKKDGSVFRYELALKTDLAVIQIAFVRLPDGLDPEARKNVMVYRPDGVPARGANLLNAFSNEYKKWVEKELTLYPDNYAAYHMKWQMAGVVDRDKVKEIVAADIDKLTREVKGEPANLLYSLSYGHLLLNHEEKSLEFLRRLVTQFPDAEYTGRALSDYAYEAYSRKFTGEGPNAVRGFVVELARQRPETDFARDKSGELANEKDAPLEVIEAICQKWIEAEPDNPHPYFNLATSYSTHKYKHEQTASLVDKAIDLTLQGKALLYGDLSIKSSEYRLVSAYKIKAEAALDQKQYGEAIAAVKAGRSVYRYTDGDLRVPNPHYRRPGGTDRSHLQGCRREAPAGTPAADFKAARRQVITGMALAASFVPVAEERSASTALIRATHCSESSAVVFRCWHKQQPGGIPLMNSRMFSRILYATVFGGGNAKCEICEFRISHFAFRISQC